MPIPAEWTFQRADIAAHFDQHVREQLPWSDLVSGGAAHLARHYLPDRGLLYDLGCSTGNVAHALAATIPARNVDYVGVDNSQEMVDAWTGPGVAYVADIRDYDFRAYDVAVAFLVLMFLPPIDRAALLTRLLALRRPGGALIIVDKVEAPDGYLGTVLHRLTIAGKVATGTPAAAIIEKELSLAGVQRPLAAAEVPDGARMWFRFGEFAGWVITD